MELAKISMQLAPSLDPQERELILAKNGTLIKKMNPKEVTDAFLVLIGQVHLETGYQMNAGAVQLTILVLIKDVFDYFGTLTIGECQKAFKLGIMKEFGEFTGLNNKTYLQFLKGYLGWNKRLEANKKQSAFNTQQIDKPIVLTEDEKDAKMKDFALTCFETTKKDNICVDPGNGIYHLLDKLGLISFTADRKRQFLGEAMDHIRTGLVNKMQQFPMDRNKFKEQLTNLSSTDTESIIMAKKIALKRYFLDLIEMQIELKDVLNESEKTNLP
jgi:hypothetical protein